jgi:hypothetical protein
MRSIHERERVELVCSLAMAAWGLWLLIPWWDTFGSSKVFDAMETIAPEWAWGAAMTLLGLARLTMWIKDGHLIKFRRAFAVASMFVWVLITVVYALGNPLTTGVPIYATLIIAESIIIIDLGRLSCH